MINFSYSFKNSFLASFESDFFIAKILHKAGKVKDNCYLKNNSNYERLCTVLNELYLRRLVYCKPKNFSDMCVDLFNKLPIVADYYHPRYIFRNALFDDSILILRGKKAQDAFENSRINLMVELKRIEKTYNSYRSRYLYNMIKGPNVTLGSFKIVLRKAIKLQSASVKLSEDEQKLYPKWVKMFGEIFDYEALSKIFGHEIVESSYLEVCPYCNAEEIRSVKGKKRHRPDIDHFLPKAKYPFFAASINNFIPAGGACNRSFKRDVDLMQGYVHPLITGIERTQLFQFDYNDVLSKIIIDLNDIPGFDLNISLFELSAVYKQRFYYNKYIQMRGKYEKLLEICADGDISKKKDLMEIFFHVSENARLRVNKKFESEALHHIIQKLEPLSHRTE